MGEAKRRGSSSERRTAAIQLKKRLIAGQLDGIDEPQKQALRTGLDVLLAQMKEGEWELRKSRLIIELKRLEEPRPLHEALPIRVKDDEIAWYIFLAEQVFEDPLCLDLHQAARNLPFIAGLGDKWRFHIQVKGIFNKIDELLSSYKATPDGVLFEILVALAYAEKGWQVEMLNTDPCMKTPDLRIEKEGQIFYIECKRQSRTSDYAEMERTEFLKRWDLVKETLWANQQWLWFKCDIHTEINKLPLDFFRKHIEEALPIRPEVTLIYDGPEATLQCRHINRAAVQSHLQKYMVKEHSPALNVLLGEDWAPPGSQVTIAMRVNHAEVVDCKAPAIGSYINDIQWAIGVTRLIDAEESIEKKARNLKVILSDAVKQVPGNEPSIIHIAYEALDGEEVEQRRVEKVMESLPFFKVDKPLAGFCLHRFTTIIKVDKLWELDETVAWFFSDKTGKLEMVPQTVVVPSNADVVKEEKWLREEY
jgi:hypothetical protein